MLIDFLMLNTNTHLSMLIFSLYINEFDSLFLMNFASVFVMNIALCLKYLVIGTAMYLFSQLKSSGVTPVELGYLVCKK